MTTQIVAVAEQPGVQDFRLNVVDPVQIGKELALAKPEEIIARPAPLDMEIQADNFVKLVLAYNPGNPEHVQLRENNAAAVEALGAKVQKEAALKSDMLKGPIRALATKGEDGGEVAKALLALRDEVEVLDPGKFDFSTTWFTRLLGLIPGMGTPLKNYFRQYESAQTTIDAIVNSLQAGKDMLGRDNIILTEDQRGMRILTIKLEGTIQQGMLIDQKLAYALERELAQNDARRRFVEEELLFPLRQRIMDLQQQLAVNQQGVLAMELIVRNNKELMKGVDRAINVTVNALTVAIIVALALANQKIVLDKINALNITTAKLLAENAERLRTQGAAIHKQASSTQLSIETLSKALSDTVAAIDDISNFRRQALPTMAENILKMEQLTAQTEQAVRRMEEGNRATPTISLDVA